MSLLNSLFGKKESIADESLIKHENNWRANDAYLYFLSRFLNGQQLDHMTQPYLEEILGDKPGEVIQQLLAEGMLEPALLPLKLQVTHSAVQLKALAKERGLKTSGTKEALVGRLLSHSPDDMAIVVAPINVYVCSEDGRRIAKAYIAKSQSARNEAVTETLNLLQKHEFDRSIHVMSSYEEKQPVKRGLGVNWTCPDTDGYVNNLKTIFSSKPGILMCLADSEWEPLRVATGMMLLWGVNRSRDWLPEGFVGVERFDSDVAARMLLFFAYTRKTVETFKKGKFKNARVIGCGDGSCPACKRIANKVYPLEAFPELPHPGCTSENGCRCALLAEPYWDS